MFSNFDHSIVTMRRLLLIIFFASTFVPLFGQGEGSNLMLIEGRIVDERHDPVSYVNVFIAGRLTGAVGDYDGNYRIAAFPGDTITFSAVSFRKTSFITPGNLGETAYRLDVILQSDTVGLKEVVIYPWPSSMGQLRKEFLEVEVEDPLANLNLQLPSMKDITAMNRTPGEPGQVGIYSGSGPISILYDQFSKEAKSRRLYAEVVRKESADRRYNRAVVMKITGLKKEEEISAFMKFCPLDDKFVLRSTDYDLFLAIRNCYEEFAQLQMPNDSIPD
jgi:hypothetical protein